MSANERLKTRRLRRTAYYNFEVSYDLRRRETSNAVCPHVNVRLTNSRRINFLGPIASRRHLLNDRQGAKMQSRLEEHLSTMCIRGRPGKCTSPYSASRCHCVKSWHGLENIAHKKVASVERQHLQALSTIYVQLTQRFALRMLLRRHRGPWR